jgi:hypothetical protein
MKHCIPVLFTALFVFLSPTYAQVPNGEYLNAKGGTVAVILAHGRAQGPDGQVVGPLRHTIAVSAGLPTLSIQLPVLATPDYLAYTATYPEAYKTIQSAVDFLVKEKGIQRIYVLGYSMGARMTTAFLASKQPPEVVGYIGIGVLEGGGELLDANLNLRKLAMPILDLYADSTPLDLSSADKRRGWAGDHYKQIAIRGANHNFRGYDQALSEAVIAWLKEREQKR